MQINGIDRLSLENLAPNKLQEAQNMRLDNPDAPATQEAVSGSENLGMDFQGLDSVHMLDADRVASLIADPFGDE